jgi:ubiquinone/menaquinone biosynthesis C-methylase UbiE
MEQDAQITSVEAVADYGLDSPRTLKTVAVSGLLALAAGILIRPGEGLDLILSGPLMSMRLMGAALLVRALLMARHSYTGKQVERDRLIGSIPWRGDEQVLDIGCGRGLLMIAAAKKLTTGKAVGMDIWSSTYLSDNWAEATWENSRLEGVEERVDVRDGDMREMPFENDSFDIALSCTAINDLDTSKQRRKVTDELFRVLKPGGKVYLIEPGFTSSLIASLKISGFEQVQRSPLTFNLFPPGRRISAVKPAARSYSLGQSAQTLQEGQYTQGGAEIAVTTTQAQDTDTQ